MEHIVGEELSKTIIEVRKTTGVYEEIVLGRKDFPLWERIFIEKFGPPLVGASGSGQAGAAALKREDALAAADAYGGIRRGQTLYGGTMGEQNIVIMIWPWSDGEMLTIKKIVCEKGGSKTL